MILAGALLLSPTGIAAEIDASGEPSGGTHALTSGFSPEQVRFDVPSGGEHLASELTAENETPCAGGWLGSAPSARFEFEQPTDRPLIFFVDTPDSDPTLAIRAPDGSWHCNDDWHSLMPRIFFADPAEGSYDVFVGSYTEGSTPSVTLVVTETERATAQH